MNMVARGLRLALMAICVMGVSLGATRANAADEDYSGYRVRRFEPYVTPDPRATAPTLAQAIDKGLLPPFGWGWYGYGWGWGYCGGYWNSYAAHYPYPYGFNGRFWFPNGPGVPFAPSGPFRDAAYVGPLPPMGYSPYLFQVPYGAGIPAADEAAHYGRYYW